MNKIGIKHNVYSTMLIVLLSISMGFVGGWLGSNSKATGQFGNSKNSEARQQIVLSESLVISDIVKSVGPSVVSIEVLGQGNVTDFYGFSRSFQQRGAGTGVIIDNSGLVITNRHVVPKGTAKVGVVLSDGTRLDNVEVVGRTNETDSLDIAFLRIKDTKGKTLPAAKLGQSSLLQTGDKVVAIGNALGELQNTVTSGIISGFGRSVEAGDRFSSENLQNLLQTDAAINPGNSGGPLVNINGEVIGINTAIAGDAQNIGFAIPLDDIAGLIKSVREKGKLLRPYLGVRYVSLNDEISEQFALRVDRGAFLAPGEAGQPTVLIDSPAARAGLRERDVIIKINNNNIDMNNSLTSVLGRFAADDKVTLTIIRDGKEQKLEVTLGTAPTE